MSRAFLKDDAVQDAVLIPPRAPLAPGAVNYVTARGLGLLRAELESLDLAERTGDYLRLTPAGVERSDAIGPALYSTDVRTLMGEYEWH